MGGYITTSQTYYVTDYYGTRYQQGTLEITVDIYGTLTWKLTMNNGKDGAPDGQGRAVGIYLEIADNIIYNSYTEYSSSSDSRWDDFPTGNDTSASGYFAVSSSSFNVTLGISCMQGGVDKNGTTGYYTFYRNYWDNITNSPYAPEIIDNGNNSFYLKGYKALGGHENPVKSDIMRWTILSDTNNNIWGWLVGSDGQYFTMEMPTDPYTSGPYYLKDYGTYPKTRGTRDVALEVESWGSRGDWVVNGYTYVGIKQYFAPTMPGIPELSDNSYDNNRLTTRKNWTFTWAPSSQLGYSGVSGYRLRLFRIRTFGNGTEENGTIPIRDSNGTIISSSYTDPETNVTDIWYDTGSTNTSFTIDPVAYGFVPGDLVRLEIFAYSLNGINEQLFSGDSSIPAASVNYLVQNAGIVRVKANDGWKEGQVCVYNGGSWKEATAVYVRDNNEWKEST